MSTDENDRKSTPGRGVPRDAKEAGGAATEARRGPGRGRDPGSEASPPRPRTLHRRTPSGCNVRYANPRTHLSVGTAYLETGLVEDAMEEFRLAAQAAHCSVDAAVGMARCHLRRGDIATAEDVLTRVLEQGFRDGADVARLHRQIALVRRYAERGGGSEAESDLFSAVLSGDAVDLDAGAAEEERGRSTALSNGSEIETVDALPEDQEAEEITFHALRPATEPKRRRRPVRAKFIIRHPDAVPEAPPGNDGAEPEPGAASSDNGVGGAAPAAVTKPEGKADDAVASAEPPAVVETGAPVPEPGHDRASAQVASSVSDTGIRPVHADAGLVPDALDVLPVDENLEDLFSHLRQDADDGAEPARSEKHYRLGVSYMDNGLWDDACQEFRKAMRDDALFVDASLHVGRCLARKGDYAEAVAELEQALGREDCPDEKVITIRYEIVRAAERAGDEARVAAELDRIDAASVPADTPKPARPEVLEMEAAPVNTVATWIFFAAMGAAVAWGWMNRHAEAIIAESGLGYVLGIIGATMMLVLLAYSARKRLPLMKKWGLVKHWYWVHMVLGTLGPVLILFHANFRMGSVNSRVALTATLLVAGSGFIGRFLHTRVHYSLHGRRVSFEALQNEIDRKRAGLATVFGYAPGLKRQLDAFESIVLKPVHGLGAAAFRVLKVVVVRRLVQVRVVAGLKRALAVTARRAGWPAAERRRQERNARRSIRAHLATGVRVTAFRFWERLLALWNVLHLPLFLLLILVAVLHVIAVHMF